jgi:type I restriction enzyme M protein
MAAPDLLVDTLREHVDAFTVDARQKFDAAMAQPEAERASSLAPARAFHAWSRRVSASVMAFADDATLRAEFARQTAYVSLIRLLLVSICEDKGLVQPGPVSGFVDYAAGRSYAYLPPMARAWAENVVPRFYGASKVFDWYRVDEKVMLRSILALNAFDLSRIDTDILGAVHGQSLLEAKHGQGRYYTPRSLVRSMLDTLGYTGRRIVGRRLGDLACGSGSFLVEACRRLLERHEGPDGRIPTENIETALAEVQRSVFGADVDPFACYLAETNLLIQVLDLVKCAEEQGLSFPIERFAIDCTDSLLVDFEGGFDFLIGNPPYVRADEGAQRYVEYRRKVEAQRWFSAQHKRWDLYVPFVEQYHRLLSDDRDARACLVTIESLATAPYAGKLRQILAREATIHALFFLERLGLFSDAKWQDNIVFCFSRGAPAADHGIDRQIARKQGPPGSLTLEPLDRVTQAATSPERLFNKRPEVKLALANTVRWDELCYVTKGMVLHASEDLDPRHPKFVRADLISDQKDSVHTRRYIGSRGVRRGGLARIEWLEYGPHTRCPSQVSRPTFQELYNRNKIMFGAFTGVAVDQGEAGEWLVTPHTVRIAVRWCELGDVTNRALTEARQELTRAGRFDPAQSRDISEWYLCAIALSEPIQRWLYANKRSMKDDVYPEDIKAIPVKRLAPAEQRPFIDLEKERHRLWAELTALEAEGFHLGAKQEAVARRRLERIEAIGAEIDRLAWALYRP